MLFNVLHYDKDLSDEDLFNYYIEANSADEAVKCFNEYRNGDEALSIYAVDTVE